MRGCVRKSESRGEVEVVGGRADGGSYISPGRVKALEGAIDVVHVSQIVAIRTLRTFVGNIFCTHLRTWHEIFWRKKESRAKP